MSSTTKCVRCEGKTRDGTRCRRKASCKVNCKDYCWQHAEDYKRSRGCSPRSSNNKNMLKSALRKKSSPRKKQPVRYDANIPETSKDTRETGSKGRVPSKEYRAFKERCNRYQKDCDAFARAYEKESARSKRSPATKRFYRRCSQRVMCPDPYREAEVERLLKMASL